jgi:hypothetical protein
MVLHLLGCSVAGSASQWVAQNMDQMTAQGLVQRSDQWLVKMADQLANGWSFCLMGGQDGRLVS